MAKKATPTAAPAAVDHGERDHATWSASSTARNWECSGALAMAATVTTPEKENPAAAWGTACHQVSEKCLRSGKDPIDFLGTVEKTKQHSIKVDEELCTTAAVYVDYVRERIAAYVAEFGEEPVVIYEQRFSLNKHFELPFDAGGMGDTVIYFPKWSLIEVIDLKGGRGLVEAADNKQLRTYGLGAALENAGLKIDKVMSTIVQPRAGHKDGFIRSETYHIADLVEWTADLLVKMKLSKEAIDAMPTMPFAAWCAKYLVAGTHCKFCRREGNCPAQEQKVLDAVGVWFDADDVPQISNDPRSGTPAELARSLDMLDMIGDWINARRAFAHSQAEAGVEIFDPETDARYQLVDRTGHRKWKAGDDTNAVLIDLYTKADLTPDEATVRELKSPAQIEKVLGARRKHLIADLVVKPVTGTNLVRTTKTTRPAVAGKAERFFEEPGTSEKD